MTDQSREASEWSLVRFHPCTWVILSLPLFSFFFVVSSASAQARLKVEWEGGHLSVTAEKVPLSQILQEVAHRTGIEVQGGEGLQEEVSVSFAGLPLSEGLQKLLTQVNYLLVDGAGPQEGPRPMLALIFGRRAAPPPVVIPTEGEAKRESEPAAEDEEERLKALRAAAQQGNKEVLREALADANLTIQTTALALLAEQNRQEAVTFLVEATKSDQPQVRFQSLQLLSQTDQVDERTVLSTLGEAVTDGDETVKGYAVQALAERGGPGAMELLGQALHDPDPSFRRTILEQIARTVPPEQSLPLLQEATADRDEAVRSLASSQLKEAKEAVSEGK
jgi:HEAT repeats